MGTAGGAGAATDDCWKSQGGFAYHCATNVPILEWSNHFGETFKSSKFLGHVQDALQLEGLHVISAHIVNEPAKEMEFCYNCCFHPRSGRICI
ncbi:hypothetical protein PoB_003764200 [Plakobranchus ocellatus]|uniref:Uncharacterized protein n=1 Tax=Plakobranchus ocellatus TaxID=259542 RepID=A0AAV4AV02_9GAST|nr:hypothetical protein PoB_003764200 [Plakobranchus ocellatus]